MKRLFDFVEGILVMLFAIGVIVVTIGVPLIIVGLFYYGLFNALGWM